MRIDDALEFLALNGFFSGMLLPVHFPYKVLNSSVLIYLSTGLLKRLIPMGNMD